DRTTVATQALYLLNDPFVRQQSLALAGRLLRRADLGDVGRINLAYRLTLGRVPTAPEMQRVRTYLWDYETAARTAMVPQQPKSGSDKSKRTKEPVEEQPIQPPDAK